LVCLIVVVFGDHCDLLDCIGSFGIVVEVCDDVEDCIWCGVDDGVGLSAIGYVVKVTLVGA